MKLSQETIVRILTALLPRDTLRKAYHRYSALCAKLKYGDSTFPRIFSIEINTHCNRACTYCPNSISPQKAERMKPAVFLAVVERLREIRYGGVVDFVFFSEPTLHPDLAGCIKLVKDRVPNAITRICTNGDLLDEAKVKTLLAAGLARIYVMRHNPTPAGWRERMERLAQRFSGLFVPMDIDEVENTTGLHDFGGRVPVRKARVPMRRNGHAYCNVHTHCAQIGVQGDWLLCCVDYERTVTLGNLCEQSILEIWKSPGFRSLRRDLDAGIAKLPVCRRCPCLTLPVERRNAKRGESPSSSPDQWSGHCYRCGHLLNKERVHRLHFAAGKPPQHLCDRCFRELIGTGAGIKPANETTPL